MNETALWAIKGGGMIASADGIDDRRVILEVGVEEGFVGDQDQYGIVLLPEEAYALAQCLIEWSRRTE